jgi:putative ATP-dependent endonuclease of OLD family
MEYHGMGTRSWSSLLTLKSFIGLLASNAETGKTVFFPVLAIEEPEAHLHPNAQKQLYSQINSIAGQKIISTHSPYIAAVAELGQIRNFYNIINRQTLV